MVSMGTVMSPKCVVTSFENIELGDYPVIGSSTQTDQGSFSSIRLGDPAQDGKIGPLHDEQKGKIIFFQQNQKEKLKKAENS